MGACACVSRTHTCRIASNMQLAWDPRAGEACSQQLHGWGETLTGELMMDFTGAERSSHDGDLAKE